MGWTFLWLMLFLKIPIVGLLSIVWWAVRQEPEQAPDAQEDGGSKHRPHARPPRPRHPRRPRGPHAEPAPPSPARVRTTIARARRVQH